MRVVLGRRTCKNVGKSARGAARRACSASCSIDSDYTQQLEREQECSIDNDYTQHVELEQDSVHAALRRAGWMQTRVVHARA